MPSHNRQKKKKNKASDGRRGPRSGALAQGTGHANTNPFPIGKRSRNKGSSYGGGAGDPDCLDAFCTTHLSLPRAVAPYTVLRVTSLVTTDSIHTLLGPMMTAQSIQAGGDRSLSWCNQVGIRMDSTPGALASGNVTRICLPKGNLGFAGCSLTPAAFSIQVMNPASLQTTKGIVAMGRLKLATTFNGPQPAGVPPLSVEDCANNNVSYFSPRLLAAAKICMRGIQTNCIPVDMNDLSEFTTYDQRLTNGTQYENTDQSPAPPGLDGVVPKFHGFAPIFISNPDKVALQLLVSTEYRVRFDPTNPAAAGAVMHTPASTKTWDNVITSMVARGNGVVDIAEKVAEYGGNARKLLARAGAVAGLLM